MIKFKIKNNKKIQSAGLILIVIFFSFISVSNLLKPGLHPTHDGEYHVVRFYEFHKVLNEGNLYPRWAPDFNFGFGIPLFNYVYPFPNYFSALMHFLSFSFINAFKLNLFFATIVGGIFFYLWTKRFWGSIGGLISSVFYIYSPYHFVDIFVRGSVGEVWALCFFPAFLWSITEFIFENDNKYIIITPILLSLLIFSHNILALMFTIFGMIYVIYLIIIYKKYYLLKKLILMFFLGFGLSSIFWLPALLESGYVKGLQIYNLKENFPEIYQLIFPSWGSGFSKNDLQNLMSYQIGILNLIVVFILLIKMILGFKNHIKRNLILFFLSSFFIVFILMLEISLPIWEKIPLLSYFQFPWRLLSLETLITAFLAGGLIEVFNIKSVKINFFIFLIILIISIFFTVNYRKPAYFHLRDDNYYLKKSNFIDSTNSPGNYFNTIWSNLKNKKEVNKIDLVDKTTQIDIISIKSIEYVLLIQAQEKTVIKVNTSYFPGWRYKINGVEKDVERGTDGSIVLTAPRGKYNLLIKFENTPLRSLAVCISAFSLFLLILLSLKIGYAKIRK